MKKLLLFLLLFVSVVANAQKGISYQAVILDPTKIELPGQDIAGQPLVNGNVWVKFAIVSGSSIQFEEVQQTKTDAYGLVNLTIGSVATTAFNAIIWDATQKSLQVFVSFDNGATYTKVSDQKLSYSPYALFAETAGKLGSTLGIAGGGTGATTAVGARANLGLGNVDNTSDADKPISSATQAALNLKANVADVNAALALKATVSALEAHMKITADTTMLATKAALTDLNSYAPINSPALTGAPTAPTASPGTNSTQIATTAYTDAAVAVAMASSGVADNSISTAKIANGAVTDAKITSVAGSKITGVIPVASGGTGAISATAARSNLGLGSVDNTSDLSKPISTLTQNALNLKAQIASPTFSGTITSGSSFSGNGRIKILSNNNTYSDAVGNQLYIDSYVKTYTGPAGNIPVYSTAYINANTLFNSQNSVTIDNATALHLLPPTNYSLVASNLWALYAEGNIKSTGTVVATGFKTPSGTSSQYLMADGSVSSAQNSNSYVDLTSAQTVAGVKTFSSNLIVNGLSVGRGNGNNDESVAIGQGAMGSSNVNGKRNTAIGAGTMSQYNGTSWDNNTAVGYRNMPSLTSGSGNTSVGAESMLNLLTGTENTSIGNQSLINVTGSSNVGVGKRSGQTITTGSQNTIVGTDADVSSATLNNATAVGYGAQVTASNSIQLGNGSVTNVKTSGTLTAGAITYPNTVGTGGQVLTTDGSGSATWASASSSQWTTVNSNIYFNTGNVGIGVSSPGSGFNTKLDLQGRASFRTNGANSGLVFDGYSPSGSLQVARIYTDATSGTPSDFVLGTYPNGHMKQLFLKQSNGYVGVNNDNPTAQLDVTGSIQASGTLKAGAVTYPNSDGSAGQVLTTDGSGAANWANTSGTTNSIWVNNLSFEMPSTPTAGVESFYGIFNGYYYKFLSLYNDSQSISQTRSYITPPTSWGNGSYTVTVYYLTSSAASGNIKLSAGVIPVTMSGLVTTGNEFQGNSVGGFQHGSASYGFTLTAAANTGDQSWSRPLQKASFTQNFNFSNIDYAVVQLGRYLPQGFSYSDTYPDKVYILGVKITKN
ncbi:beta strand repeat-containing protein [Aquirufa antheringensis]